MPKLKRETEMKRIEKQMQKLKNRLDELGYTLTDHYSTLTIFDDQNVSEENDFLGEVVGHIS